MKTTLALLLVALSIPSVAAQDVEKGDIIFARKIFVDNPQILGGFVSISGTLTGDGLIYKNNTINIACYKDRAECTASKIDQIGPHQLGDVHAPNFFSVTKWEAEEVVADNGIDCPRIIVTLDRKTQTATWVQGVFNPNTDPGDNPCTYPDKQIYKWTIEDPP
jgi:hypothetical protein